MVLNHIHDFAVDPSGCGVVNKARGSEIASLGFGDAWQALTHASHVHQTLIAVAIAGNWNTFAQMVAMQKGPDLRSSVL